MPRNKSDVATKRKPGSRKTSAKVKGKASKKAAKVVKAKTPVQPPKKSAGANRREGIRLFKLAGRPSTEQFVLVYGERGPRMTWAERTKAGVPAEKFQQALAAKSLLRRAQAK